jgi:hypothetical protein
MNPYPGLRPFEEDEASFYVGRDIVTGMVATRLRISPLTVLFARSGVGKSSFLNCRLLPSLRQVSRVEKVNEWGGAAPDAMVGRYCDYLGRNGHRGAEKPVLILDQFEDVFKVPCDREALWDRLAEVVNVNDAPLHVLISMREEWLGAWEEASDYLPNALSSTVRLAPLSDVELLRAVQRPAEIERTIDVEPALAAELLSDLRRPSAFGLGDGYVEPGLLQLVCHQLWEEARTHPTRRMDVALYESLGRADLIIRGFVWRDLGGAGTKEALFSPSDRVLWVGLTRHLTVAHGVKAIVSPLALAKKLKMQDLGLAGPAIAAGQVTTLDRRYLERIPEKRGEPPPHMVWWISEVLKKGVALGFLKQQRGLGVGPGGQDTSTEATRLYELSHDSLGDIFQQFSLEFESWVRWRAMKLAAAVVGGALIVPAFLILWWIWQEPWQALAVILGGILVTTAYFAALWVIGRVAKYLAELMLFPVIRRIATGVVPLKSRSKRSPPQ